MWKSSALLTFQKDNTTTRKRGEQGAQVLFRQTGLEKRYHVDIEPEDAGERKRERGLPGAGRAVEEVPATQRDTAVSVPPGRLRVQVLVDVGEDLQLLVLVEHDRPDVSDRAVGDLLPVAGAPRVPRNAQPAGPLDDGSGLVVAVVHLLNVCQELLDGL